MADEQLIEAMAIALSLADPDERGLPVGTGMAAFYRGLATAALAALRETHHLIPKDQVPVARLVDGRPVYPVLPEKRHD